jgi:hypothetical protein
MAGDPVILGGRLRRRIMAAEKCIWVRLRGWKRLRGTDTRGEKAKEECAFRPAFSRFSIKFDSIYKA